MCGELPSSVPLVRVHATEPLAIASLNVYPIAVVLTIELVAGLTEVKVGAVVSKVIPVTETSVAALPPASVPLNAIV